MKGELVIEVIYLSWYTIRCSLVLQFCTHCLMQCSVLFLYTSTNSTHKYSIVYGCTSSKDDIR